MAYLRNDAINRVNIHSSVQALAQGAGGIFFLVYMVRAGISVPMALVAQSAVFALRFALRPAVLPLAKRFGLKPLVIAGTLMLGLQYPILSEVQEVGPVLFVLVGVAALGDILYWPAYNAWFASLGDAEHRGHQVSAREAMVAAVSVIAPVLGTWALVTLGPRPMFAMVGVVQALSILPLAGVPNVAVKRVVPGMFTWARPGILLYALDAWFDSFFFMVWPIALFLALDESFAAYGGAMALAALVGAGFGLLLGRAVDLGRGRRAVAIGCSVAAAVILFRAGSLGNPWLAVAANAAGGVVMPLLIPTLGTAGYNLAKASPCPLRFGVAAEAGWDVGCIAGCLSAAALVAAGVPISATLLLALPGMAATAVVLTRYYDAGAAVRAPA
jgi:MFS transporter, DHA1 family, inner membrane transport protein